MSVNEWRRNMSSVSSPPPEKKSTSVSDVAVDKTTEKEGKNTAVSSYWAVPRPEITADDGSKWRWNCFTVKKKKKSIYF